MVVVCTSCATPLTVKHILNECWNFEKERRDSYLHLSKSLNLDPCNVPSIVEFLHNSKRFSKI